MNQAGPDWQHLAQAAKTDAALAALARGGALLLWDRAAERPGHVDRGALALFGGSWLGKSGSSLPDAARRRLNALADGLAPSESVRLERLRLTQGFAATPLTCACKLVDGVLALVVPADELRRAGIAVPVEQPVERSAGESPEAALPPTEAPAPVPQAGKPLPATLRVLWQSDAASRLTSLSANVATLVGSEKSAALTGLRWDELIDRDILDRSGDLVARLGRAETLTGHDLLWRFRDSDEGVRVELSGMPLLDAERRPQGFRGFALARLTQREPFPAVGPVEEAAAAPGRANDVDDGLADTALSDGPAAIQNPPPGEAQGAVSKDAPEDCSAPATILRDAVSAEAAPRDEGSREIDAEAESLADEIAETDDKRSPDQAIAPDEEATEEAHPEPAAKIVSQLPTAETKSPTAEKPAEPSPAGNIVMLHNGQLAQVRPVLEPSKANLSSAERNAFREIAKALGARIAGEDEAEPRLPPAATLKLRQQAEAETEPAAEQAAGKDQPLGKDNDDRAIARLVEAPAAEPDAQDATSEAEAPETEAQVEEPTRPRLPNSHADLLDKLPIAVLVNRGEEPLYANRTLLDLLDYADLDDLTAGGGVSRIVREAESTEGGPMILVDRRGQLVSVDAVLSSVAWHGEPATMMAFRHPNGGGEAVILSEEEAEAAELAAEFAAEDAESAARVEALRMDVGVREARIDELNAMLDTATDGVVTVDGRGRILSLNRTAEALFGYDQREVTGELFTLLFAAESHAPALDYLEGLKGGGVVSVLNDGREVVGRVRQGGKIPLFMTMGRITDGDERRFCAVLRDITAWKKAEGELVEARRTAERASAQKSDVLAKISHEIRTPLNAIIGFAEVMAEERFGPIDNERYKEYLRDIHQSGGYVISLVNDLLDLAKIEAGKLDLDFVSVNLNEIALSAVALLQPEAQRQRVVLRSGLSPKLPPVVADQRSIRQIVINLLSNAVKFTDGGGQVIVSTALGDQGEAILRVRDTGIGMDDDELKLALEPFRQVPTTRRSGGTGLGLPLTKALVEANRAAMAITSVKKEGTLVEITFPPQRVLAG